ncbi:hypothetical protein RBH88_01340 [Aminobacterium sp. MB27-C1]|uniref:hypothetical protein n=1 Tax=Aminobacterium sp. MB27-C1 TaxID=3070661 RepID=UPI001BCC98FF|nr:hypothetical protein [Aminobacterium sp. MB27-C1]WMI71763.1 hypothetical protein RBH88_01340 [Aminobacterium sp. MB27-C1]
MRRIVLSVMLVCSLYIFSTGSVLFALEASQNASELTFAFSDQALAFLQRLPQPLYLDWGYYRGI